MKPTLFAIVTVLPLLAGFIPTAGVVRAGCAGPNGPSSPDHEGQRPPERTECA
jgi:hypothetical protein